MNVLDFRSSIKSDLGSLGYACTECGNRDVFSHEHKYLFDTIEVKYFSKEKFIKISTTLSVDDFYPSDSDIFDVNRESDLVKFDYDNILDELYPSFVMNYYEKENFIKLFNYFLYEAEKGLKQLSE